MLRWSNAPSLSFFLQGREKQKHLLRVGVAVLFVLALATSGLNIFFTHQTAHAATAQLGLNIDANEQAYTDLIGSQGRIDPISGVTLTSDTNGWPSSDFSFVLDNRYTFGWVSDAVNIDPLKKSTDLHGTYKLVFTGKATLADACDDPAHCSTTIANQQYDAGSNTTTADITFGNPSGGLLAIVKFTNTQRNGSAAAGSGVTNLHLWRPGYTPGTSQVFTDTWLSSLLNHNWVAFRFMGFTGTNGYGDPATDGHPNNELYPYHLQWNTDRAKPDSGPLYGNVHPGVHGAPWEYVIQIAQITHKDIWINIPVNASDDYVNQLATLFKNGNQYTGNQGIPSDTHIYVEYSNEMWHFGFHQGPWNNQAAKDEIAAGGSNLNYDGNTDDYTHDIRRIAKRTGEIGNQFKTVFGDNGTRIRPVVNNANVGYDTDMLNYVKNNYGTVSNYLYGISQTGYYSSADKSSVDAIIAGEKTASDNNKTGYQQSRSIATQFGIHSLVYEGGQDEEGNPKAPSPLDPTLANQFGAARDARMQDVEVHDIVDNWYGSGGELYMQFGHVGRYSTFGMWGLSDDVTNQSTGKWKGVDQVMGTPVSTPTPTQTPTSTPTSTPTPTPQPGGWTFCANEGGTCTFSGTQQVRYGANGTYNYQTATGSIACNNATFGDPTPGVVKHCDVSSSTSTPTPTPTPTPTSTPTPTPQPGGWTFCANEGGTCTFSGTQQVRYGANGTYAYKTATGSIACNNATFGDPLPNVVKHCDVSSSTSTPTPTPVPTKTYLSDLTWTSATTGYGSIQKDKSVNGNTLTLRGTTYAKGLGVHAISEIHYALNKAYATFTADVGIDDESGTAGSVQFQVYADGVKIFDSGVVHGGDPVQHINVNVSNVQDLELYVGDGGNGINSDHADWAGAALQ